MCQLSFAWPSVRYCRHQPDFCRLKRFGRLLLCLAILWTHASAVCRAQSSFTSLLSFMGSAANGPQPIGNLLQASDKNFYGVTSSGGTNGFGTVFKVTSTGTLTTLYNFTGINEGGYPQAGLLLARDGNLYGTNTTGRANGAGVVFQITLGGAVKALYSFNSAADGSSPLAALIQGNDGNLYGTASYGGAHGYGTIFEVTTGGAFTTRSSFTGSSDGGYPYAGVIQATDGALYGATLQGGANFEGTIFKITTDGEFTLLYSFSSLTGGPPFVNSDGARPNAGLIQASDGDFYGTAFYGGANGTGTIFKITTAGAFSNLYSFSQFNDDDTNFDGALPQAGLIQAKGNTPYVGSLYGMASYGGLYNCGTIFQISFGSTTQPVITSLAPNSVPANTAFTLTINGGDFQSGAKVSWNNHALKTSVLSPTQAQAAVTVGVTVPLSTYPGLATITLRNPNGTSVSTSIAISVPVPMLKKLVPSTLPAGSGDSLLVLDGAAFAPGAVVNWNGSTLETTFVTPTELTATIPAADLAKAGTALVSVTNPSGGGTSKVVKFVIGKGP